MLGSKDTTRKFLFRLDDGNLIESVLIPASPALYGERSDRRTICVSTQVGCAYGCKFCASGLDGFSRNLEPSEIVDQLLAVEKRERREDRQRRLHGHGRTAGQPHQRAARDPNHQCALGTRDRRAPHHGFDQRPRAADPQTRGRTDCNSGSPSRCTARPTKCATRSCRLTANTTWPLCSTPAITTPDARKQRIYFEYILIAGVNDS